MPNDKLENKPDVKSEKLYNLKIDKPKDMEYDNNIAELAHKDKVIVSPSYDRMNSLVENINERQKILINIIKKPVNGYLVQKKYAEQQLSTTLMQVANDMDNRNLPQLTALADKCLEQLHEQAMVKEAFPLAIPIIAAIAIAGGLIYFQQHTNFKNEGLVRNGEILISELEDLITSGSGTLSLHSSYSEQFKNQMKHVQATIRELLDVYEKIKIVVEQLETPKTQNELENIVQNGQKISTKPAFKAAYELFKATAKNLQPMLETLMKNFKSQAYKARQTKDKGTLDSISDFFGGILYGGGGLVADEFDDVLREIPTFQKSVKEILDIIAGAETAEQDAVKKVQSADMSFQSMEPSSPYSGDLENKSMADLIKEVEKLQDTFNAPNVNAAKNNDPMKIFAQEIKNWKKL